MTRRGVAQIALKHMGVAFKSGDLPNKGFALGNRPVMTIALSRLEANASRLESLVGWGHR